ncbi:von Willebrand factor A domain-containing protein 7-like [Montipora foliosa]|uniref:von Willebrand factor A domain-containing protein 7-like n=1 Tax=Montipora foliosa TaxID=591990 RepID=UPI0035F13127
MATLNYPILLVLVVQFIITVKAFLPRSYLTVGNSSSLDHAVITKQGFFKPLLQFLLANPQYLKDEQMVGSLRQIQMSDPPKALQAMIETISPQMKFLTALNEIQSANVEVDSFPLNKSASVHFDAEQLKEGSERIIKLRQELITSLLNGEKLQHARNLAGIALHTLQDFYSHSNWIELGHREVYDVLVQPGSEIPSKFIAGPMEATCKSCSLELGLCKNNLNTFKLTSGYRSGQDIEKPKNVGKCSHGGKLDESRLEPAVGGINKDSASYIESPHANLHNIAADLAIEATSLFVTGIREAVGDVIFAKFLNMNSARSLALVIDVSGSMSDEINDVKRISINFVKDTLKKKGISFTYILVPFSDPEVGPVTVTNDAQEVIDAVNNLAANGGGDCPELGMAGLYQALLRCLPESVIVFFSDADSKDEHRKNEVSSLAKEKKVKLLFRLTGKCARRKKRHAHQTAVLEGNQRTRRSLQGQALYQDLATQTGGQVLLTSKESVADVVKLIDPGSPTNSSFDLKEVELLNVEERRGQHFSGKTYFIDIDSTLERLVLVLSAASSPNMELKSEKGKPTFLKKVLSSSNKLLIYEVTNLISGSLKILVSCNGPYTLQASGSSPLDFTYQLLDVEDLERGATRRVVGNPLRGQTLLLTMDFVGKGIEQAISLTLVGINGTDLEKFSITEGRGFYQGSYFATFIPTAGKFRLKVTGIDKSGAPFQRMKPTLFTLGDVKFSPNVVSRSGLTTVFPAERSEVEINVTNSGDSQTIYFSASDDLSYVKSVNPSQANLQKNGTIVLRVALLAPSDASYGVTSTVTVFASQNPDYTQVVNFMVFFVTVASKKLDVSPPKCSVMTQSGTCASVFGRQECVSATWHARVNFSDSGEGLLSITTRDNVEGSLKVDEFRQGAVETSVKAIFTSNCCNPRVVFVGIDLVGNAGTCAVSLVPDIVLLRAKPNSTTVSLLPGETSKLPFTLDNFGSKGSFSFQVTKTPELISYVIPFSPALESNASVAGHVIIKSVGETDEVKNLTVTAVSQSENVNEKIVTLFHILVFVSSGLRPTTTAIKHVRLVATVPFHQVSIIAGETAEVNFTLRNLALAEVFSFKVLSNQSTINGSVRPSSLALKQSQNVSCVLILTCDLETPATSVTHVNITAKSASHNAQDKELLLFSLTITVIPRSLFRVEYMHGENKLAIWHVALIIILVLVLILISTVLLVLKLKHTSWRPKQFKEESTEPGQSASSHLLTLKKLNDETV